VTEPPPDPATDAAQPPPLPSTREVLGDRSVRLLLSVTFLSTAGSVCQLTALGKIVYDLSGREIDLGLLGLAEFLPAVALVFVSGHVADRFDRRRVLAIALAGEMVCSLALAAYVASDPTAVGPIFGLVALFGTARAFAAPAARSMPPDVVGHYALPRLIPFSSMSWQAATIVGPVLGGLLFVVSPTWPFYAAATFAFLAGIATFFIRLPHKAEHVPDEEERPTLHDAFEGLRVIRRNAILLGAISLDLFAVLFGGAIALLPAIAEERLGVGAVGLGWLRAAGGIGAAATAGCLAARPVTRHVGRVLLLVVALFGVFTITLGLTHSYAVAFLSMVALSAADAVSVFIRATLVPLVTPDAARGRVFAVENVFIGASNELGAFESGVAGQVLGAGGAVVLGGVATLAISAGWWVLFPALRRVDRFSDLRRDQLPVASTPA